MIASFTKWDNSLSGTLGAGPMGVPLSEVLLYFVYIKLGSFVRILDTFSVVIVQSEVAIGLCHLRSLSRKYTALQKHIV